MVLDRAVPLEWILDRLDQKSLPVLVSRIRRLRNRYPRAAVRYRGFGIVAIRILGAVAVIVVGACPATTLSGPRRLREQEDTASKRVRDEDEVKGLEGALAQVLIAAAATVRRMWENQLAIFACRAQRICWKWARSSLCGDENGADP